MGRYYIPTNLTTVTFTGTTLLYGAFSGCTKITRLNITSATNLGYCFAKNCSSLTRVDLNVASSTTKVTSRSQQYCWFWSVKSSCVVHIPSGMSASDAQTAYGQYWRYYSSSGQLSYTADL